MDKKGLVWFVAIVGVIVLAMIFNPLDDQAESKPVSRSGVSPGEAIVACENAVRDVLVSPATMRTPGFHRPYEQADGSWRYAFPVDSQNRFGAVIRTNWVCKYANGHADVGQAP